MVDVTLRLLRAATKDPAKYYHLLSGADLPIKTMDEICEYLDTSSEEFIGIVPNESWYSVRPVKYYHPLHHNRWYRTSRALRAADRALEWTQRILQINRIRNRPQRRIYDGWQWFSITHPCARYIIDESETIARTFRHTTCPDELFIQTILMDSPFRNGLHNALDLSQGSRRYIAWQKGGPRILELSDLDKLLASDLLFARKFDSIKNLETARQLEIALHSRHNTTH